jgi:hypothetical protein
MLAVSLDIGGRHIGCENAAQPGAVPVLPGSLLLLQTDGGAHKRERERMTVRAYPCLRTAG